MCGFAEFYQGLRSGQSEELALGVEKPETPLNAFQDKLP
jgi:hypothetical protein